jgi:hypothetical protein
MRGPRPTYSPSPVMGEGGAKRRVRGVPPEIRTPLTLPRADARGPLPLPRTGEGLEYRHA